MNYAATIVFVTVCGTLLIPAGGSPSPRGSWSVRLVAPRAPAHPPRHRHRRGIPRSWGSTSRLLSFHGVRNTSAVAAAAPIELVVTSGANTVDPG